MSVSDEEAHQHNVGDPSIGTMVGLGGGAVGFKGVGVQVGGVRRVKWGLL